MFPPLANYGNRLRIGMMLPSVNLVAEPMISALLPAGVSLHTTRFNMPRSPADLEQLPAAVEQGTRLLVDACVDLIVFHCTAVSMMQGGAQQNVEDIIEKASGRRTITTGQAVVTGLRVLGARKIVMICPQPQSTYESEAGFLRAHGIDLIGGACMGILGGKRLFDLDPEAFYRLTMDHRSSAAEAYLISCTAVRSCEVIEALERDLDCPVLTSNQAMLWHALRVGGVPDAVPLGRLLRMGASCEFAKAFSGPGT